MSNLHIVAIIGQSGTNIFDSLLEHENFTLALMDSSKSLSDIVNLYEIDVIHTPIQFYQNHTLLIPMVNTLHDLQQYHYPDFFSSEELQFRATYYKRSAEFSERVIVSYQHVKEDIIKHYGISSDKIDVCPLGMPFVKKS